MPLGTLDRAPPPFFKQGASTFTKLILFSAVALFFMTADARYKVMQPLRFVVATAIYPVQWLALQPVHAATYLGRFFSSVDDARSYEDAARKRLAVQAQRAQQSEQLAFENARLRKLLDLREALTTSAIAAEVLYDAADPYTRKVIIDKGGAQGIMNGSPVVDELGVVGQVTRVYPLSSEISLLFDPDYTMPVLNTRTGVRSVAYGDPKYAGGSVELRWNGGNADVQSGDLLTTSGVDGVYPSGLAVARVDRVERRADTGFARIHAIPVGMVRGTRHVLVLKPVTMQIAPRPVDEQNTSLRKVTRK